MQERLACCFIADEAGHAARACQHSRRYQTKGALAHHAAHQRVHTEVVRVAKGLHNRPCLPSKQSEDSRSARDSAVRNNGALGMGSYAKASVNTNYVAMGTS